MKRLNLLVIFVLLFSCTWSQAQTTAHEDLETYRMTVIEPAIQGIYERFCMQLSSSERQELEALRDAYVQTYDKIKEIEQKETNNSSCLDIRLIPLLEILDNNLQSIRKILKLYPDALAQAINEYTENQILWNIAGKKPRSTDDLITSTDPEVNRYLNSPEFTNIFIIRKIFLPI